MESAHTISYNDISYKCNYYRISRNNFFLLFVHNCDNVFSDLKIYLIDLEKIATYFNIQIGYNLLSHREKIICLQFQEMAETFRRVHNLKGNY